MFGARSSTLAASQSILDNGSMKNSDELTDCKSLAT